VSAACLRPYRRSPWQVNETDRTGNGIERIRSFRTELSCCEWRKIGPWPCQPSPPFAKSKKRPRPRGSRGRGRFKGLVPPSDNVRRKLPNVSSVPIPGQHPISGTARNSPRRTSWQLIAPCDLLSDEKVRHRAGLEAGLTGSGQDIWGPVFLDSP
jgi:hypothetical protein